ncbi:MAG: type II toxin-antitoxin system PemK/MazF family toxin [Pseudomonadota bacterium]
MVIRQGDVFWADLGPRIGSEPGGRRPVVVVQSDLFNTSRVNTVVVVPMTSQIRRGAVPGNVTLRKGEANLPSASVANVGQISTFDRCRLGDKIGTIRRDRVDEILDGLDLVLRGVR